jgi:hypothetical protein
MVFEAARKDVLAGGVQSGGNRLSRFCRYRPAVELELTALMEI